MTIKFISDGNRVSITVEKKEIGYAEKKDSGRWHAVLDVPGAPVLIKLAQGHGGTACIAIDDAFVKGRADAEEFIAALDVLKNRMYGPDGKDPKK